MSAKLSLRDLVKEEMKLYDSVLIHPCFVLCISHLIADAILCSRENKTKILELLRDAWATDRRAEWSIWMVYSKVEMPHHYISSGGEDSSYHSVRGRGKGPILRKLTDDVR